MLGGGKGGVYVPTLDLDRLARQLQADLAKIQELQQRYGSSGPPSDASGLGAMLGETKNRPTRPTRQRRGKRRKAAKPTVTQTPSSICRSILGQEWHDVDYYWQKVKEVLPETSRQVVATALRRECASGGAEKRGDRKDGVEFRKS